MYDQGRSELIAELQPGVEEGGIQEVRHGFGLGNCRLLLKGGTFSELASKTPICSMPDTPVWFSGFINHRGHTVPVFDLHQWLGGEALDPRQNYWVLLVDRQPGTVGLILRQFPQVLNDPAPCALAVSETLPESISPFITAVFQHQESRWHELDHLALLAHLKQAFGSSGPAVESDQSNDNNNEL